MYMHLQFDFYNINIIMNVWWEFEDGFKIQQLHNVRQNVKPVIKVHVGLVGGGGVKTDGESNDDADSALLLGAGGTLRCFWYLYNTITLYDV